MKKFYSFLSLIVALAMFISLAACSSSSDKEMNQSSTAEDELSSTENSTIAAEESAQSTVVSEVMSDEGEFESSTYFPYDEIINDFFERYNSLSERPISPEEIEKGNIATKALAYFDDCSMEVINTKSSGYLSVSISTDPDNENTELYSIFLNTILCMQNDLIEADVSEVWDDLHSTGNMVENYDFGGILITYVPSKELSYGTSELRIDIEFPFS